MSVFQIEGGHPLSGSVRVQGAKNSVLPILAATLLAGGQCLLRNCPRLTDVDNTLSILRHLGCRVEREGDAVTVDSGVLTGWDVPDRLMREMRSSVVFLGSILGRMGKAELSYPGGCELGPRPIDLHLSALRTLGAGIQERNGRLCCEGTLTGGDITLSLPSVGATENAMLAAVAAKGVTTITNAAREPEIVDLQNFLCALGADVRGAGTSVITIRGGLPLHGGEYTIMADRIVAATYLSAVASAGGEGEITGVDWRQLSTVTAVFTEAGCRVESTPTSISIHAPERLKGVPAFPPMPRPWSWRRCARLRGPPSLWRICSTAVTAMWMSFPAWGPISGWKAVWRWSAGWSASPGHAFSPPTCGVAPLWPWPLWGRRGRASSPD